MTTLEAKISVLGDKLKEFCEDMQGKMSNQEKLTGNFKSEIDEKLTEFNLALKELEQKNARGGDDAVNFGAKSVGAQFIESEKFKNIDLDSLSKSNPFSIDVKTVNSSANSAGALIHGVHRNGIVGIAQEPLKVRDLFTPITLGEATNSYDFDVETGFVNNAKGKQEGEYFEESNITTEEKSVKICNIGHHIPVSRFALEDASQLQSLIDTRLSYGVDLSIDRQLLHGDGLNGNLQGVNILAQEFADPLGLAQYNELELLQLALLQANYANYPTDGIVLNPLGWGKILLLKDKEGRNIIGNPQVPTQPTLWATNVVQSHSMRQDKFLTGAFKMGGEVVQRQDMRIEIGTINDDFIRRKYRLLGYERIALAILRPEAFVRGTLTPKA